MAIKNIVDQADETLGSLIRWKRQQLGKRVIDLAEETGLSPGYISKIELQRATNPSDTIIYRLATALKLDPIDLKKRTKPSMMEKNEGTQESLIRPEASVNRKERRSTVSVDALSPLRHDATNVQLRLKPEARFTTAYERLAASYEELGLLYCTTAMEDGTIDYRSAFAAYDASASIYERTGLMAQFLRTRYRIARTYQNLIVTDRVKSDERLIFLQRAQEILNQVFSADEPIQPNSRQSFLKPASLAVGAAISKLIAREIRDEIGRTSISAEQQQALQAEVDGYIQAGRIRRLQADRLYAEIVRAVDVRLKDPLSEEDRLRLQEEAAYAFFLMATNKRALETDKEEAGRRDMEPSIVLFREAIRRQRDRSRHTLRLGEAGSLALQAAHRLQLARFHQELGLAYSCSQVVDRYAALLWQYRVSAEVLSAEWAERTSQRDRYIAGDQYLNDLIDSAQAGHDDPRDMTAEFHNIRTINEVGSMIARYRDAGAFDTLDYPLTYEDALKDIKARDIELEESEKAGD